ncbi:hypothetical protein LOTGIDRAFT_233665 [Lottia gigantea]|uniref:Nucleoside diphosphate kinase-like domain-containing protein n=1 Tax=Lottia gigantea TaxID=225164 RepID=V4BP06_LOTGI|nr:hypothetical protein LOTGIDRAFT_233665 [Lottia gigantea]ESO90664.1 hypothetical protein LOTGIDRAFT_233665 [Lottia gigantea]
MESSDDSDEEETLDKKEGKTTPSLLKPQLASIFSEVEQNLPSIDFDFGDISSDSDVTDEPLIFQRNLKSLELLDEDKDLDTCLHSNKVSDKPGELSPHCNKQSELSNPVNVDDISLFDVNADFAGSGFNNWAELERDISQTRSGLPNDLMRIQTASATRVEIATSTTEDLLSDTTPEKQDGQKEKKTEDYKIFVESATPLLPLTVFENVDLDSVLANINEDNQYGVSPVRPAWLDLSLSRIGSGDASTTDSSGEELTLIEKLAQLSVKHGATGLTEINPQTGATIEDNKIIYDKSQDKWNKKADVEKDVEVVKNTCSMGTNTTDLPQPTVAAKPVVTINKSDTVFIDLRGFEKHREEEKQKIERVQAILKIHNQQHEEDSSESEDETERWIKERRKIKQKLVSQGTSTDLLPNKAKSPQSKSSFKQPQRVINLSEKSPSKDGATRSSDVTSSSSDTILDQETVKKQRAAQLEKDRQMEVARKVREEKEKEREHRIRISQRLEAVRPAASINGLQPTAEATPTLYDMEASFEPAPSTLPRVMAPDQTCLLLKIHLACNGEIILHKNRTNQSVDTGEGLSASYTTLLTWLASLVPDDFTFLQRAAGDKHSAETNPWQPFYVVGLQQIVLEDKLYLVVAIMPTEHFDPKSIQSFKSKKYQGGNPFMQYVHNFLTTYTLLSVCPWLLGIVSMEVEGPKGDIPDLKSYTYIPPLPNITDKPLASFIEVHQDPQAANRIFKMATGYFWQTVDNEESKLDQGLDEESVDYETQNTMSLVYKKIYHDPGSLMGIMIRILQEGLDIAGVRLLYPTSEFLNLTSAESPSDRSDLELLNNVGPVLALAIRGTFARSIWLDAVGPSDPVLARRTDPNSLCAQFGGESREECLLFCPRNSNRVLSEMTRWFAGRIPSTGSFEVGQPYKRKDHLRSGSPKSRKGKRGSLTDCKAEDIPTQRPLATLTATTKGDMFLVISPLFLPSALGILMSTCQRRGFQIRGVKRLRLSSRRAGLLGIDSTDCPVFLNENISDRLEYPATVLLLEKENCAHNAASLIEAFMVQLTLKGLMDSIQSRLCSPVTSKQLFHAVTYTEDVLAGLGGEFSRCPDYDTLSGPSYIQPALYTNPELEQIVIVVLHGFNIQKSSGLFIGQLLNVIPYSRTPVISPLSQGAELLGLKWLPVLSTSQAKEVTPIEVGDKLWKESIHRLTSEPAFILALRGVNAFKQLESIVPPGVLNQPNKTPLHKLMSHTPEEAYNFARLFFTKHELFIDNSARPLLPYIPESLLMQTKVKNEGHKTVTNIFEIMKQGPQPIRTFLLVKPGAVKKQCLSKLLKKIVQEGFKVVGLRLDVLDDNQADVIVQSLSEEDESVKEKQKLHLVSGPVILLCLERENAVFKLVDILGPLDPQAARRKSQFLWRGIFGSDPVANGLYGSVNYCQAVEELRIFFNEDILLSESLDNQTQAALLEDQIIDIDYKLHRNIEIDYRGESLNYEDSSMADIHASLLVQTNCLLLSPPLLGLTPRLKGQGYVEVIEALISEGFRIVGARMVTLSQNQTEQFLCLLEAGSFKQVPLLTMGPCLVLAVQRDNAVISFDTLLDSIHGDSIMKKYGSLILRSSTVPQGEKHLT